MGWKEVKMIHHWSAPRERCLQAKAINLISVATHKVLIHIHIIRKNYLIWVHLSLQMDV